MKLFLILLTTIYFFILSSCADTPAQLDKEITSSPKLDSNDCSGWIEVKEDKVMGTSTVTMKNPPTLRDTSFGVRKLILIDFGKRISSKGDVKIYFSAKVVGDLICFNDKSRINILFKDETRLEILSDIDFNCDGLVIVYFDNTDKKYLNDLKSKKIDIIRFWTTNGYVEGQLSERESAGFLKSLNCLIE